MLLSKHDLLCSRFTTKEESLTLQVRGKVNCRQPTLACASRCVYIVCIPLFNWIYAKGCERGVPGLAHVVRGGWQLFSSEVLVRLLFPKGVGEVIWS